MGAFDTKVGGAGEGLITIFVLEGALVQPFTVTVAL
jgi:hypothetical protein